MTTTTATADTWRDFAALVKPSITLQVMITTAGGLWLAPGELGWLALVAALFGTVFIVASANTLNCYLERDSDRFMARTAGRPLPDGRMIPLTALRFGVVLAVVAIPMLAFVNPVTGLLAALALVSYVWVYTPMKQLSPHAVIVGAIPGAMPPLMGWTAVTGRVEWPGLVLFGILFLWQMPHFIAISVYRLAEYDRAGIYTVPSVFGISAARWHMIFWTALLIPVSFLLVPLGVAGWIYAGITGALGLGFVWWVLKGFRVRSSEETVIWARSFFLYTLVYLTLLFAALLVDALPWPF